MLSCDQTVEDVIMSINYVNCPIVSAVLALDVGTIALESRPNSPTCARLSNLLYTAELCT